MKSRLLRTILGLSVVLAIAVIAGILVAKHFTAPVVSSLNPSVATVDVEKVNTALQSSWKEQGVEPTPSADALTLARRLSLALTGAPPSLEEIRRMESLPADADSVQAWLDHLFADRRFADYTAERFARAFVGTEPGPFLVYRRRRFVNWLADQLVINRPYDQIVHDMVAAEGVWTTHPESNFITVSVIQNGENKGPDEIKLAARTTRAFLGFSLDCVQCHDDKFSDQWKQEDFHQLASFFAQSEMAISGVSDNKEKEYDYRFNGMVEEQTVPAVFPYQPELSSEGDNRRAMLADWITHDENRPFARATVNRTWALLFGRPLIEPVDDIPLEGPFPAGFEELAGSFIASGHDLHQLIRTIAATDAFQRESRSADPAAPVTPEQEEAWAAFPVTPLRPEQVAGSIVQSSTLQALDADTHIVQKLRRFFETRDFVKRYGDQGEAELQEESGTIPQRLLLMNGKLVGERTKSNPIMNAPTRLAGFDMENETVIEAAFLSALTRYPDSTEQEYFVSLIEEERKKSREHAMADVYWALYNSTEFSWNR